MKENAKRALGGPEDFPKHIAFIMDGNGRWAKKFFLNKTAGHKAGATALRKLSERMNAEGFSMITVYAFSTENWSRSDEEVAGLMNLLRNYIQEYINDTKKNNMRICTIGDITRLDSDLRQKIKHLAELTADNAGMRVNIAINYGGRDEIVRAVKQIAGHVKNGTLNPSDITESLFSGYLDTKDLPDPDLIIRTAGEMRLSNFLSWQSAYSEFYSCEKYWPDFNYDDLCEVLTQFKGRERRFGGRL